MKVFDVKCHAAQQICRSVPYCFVDSFRRLRPHSKRHTESMVFLATFPWGPFNQSMFLEDQMAHLGRWHISVVRSFSSKNTRQLWTSSNCSSRAICNLKLSKVLPFSCTKKALYKSPTTFRNLVVFVIGRGDQMNSSCH